MVSLLKKEFILHVIVTLIAVQILSVAATSEVENGGQSPGESVASPYLAFQMLQASPLFKQPGVIDIIAQLSAKESAKNESGIEVPKFADQIHESKNKSMLLIAALLLIIPGMLWVFLNIWIMVHWNGACSLTVSQNASNMKQNRDMLPTHVMDKHSLPGANSELSSIPYLADEERMDVYFESLTYWVGQKPDKENQLLTNLSGKFSAGNITAIMGPSGAGKSTLLDLVALRRSKGCYAGTITTKNCKAWKGYCAYVEQVDQVVEELTVEGNLLFYAHLKMKRATLWEKRHRVESLLHQLRLYECKHVRAGGDNNSISGGQKRRLSVAIALLDLPKVIYLDEPTSGLDASSALELIQLLKSIAQSGRTVVLTIHQPRPEIFATINNLYILAKGGLFAYGGSPKDAHHFFTSIAKSIGFNESHFENAGTADLILDVLSMHNVYHAVKKQLKDSSRSPELQFEGNHKLDLGGPWICEEGDKMVSRRTSTMPLIGVGSNRKRSRKFCNLFTFKREVASVYDAYPKGGRASKSDLTWSMFVNKIIDNIKHDIWAVIMLSVRDMRGNGQGQGRKRFNYFIVNLAACVIISSVYWQYEVQSYADMFPLLSSMYLAVISCLMVVQFTQFQLFICEAQHLSIDHKREAYTSLAYFLHCLFRDSFFFSTGTAMLWMPATYAINFAGGSSTPEGSFTSLLIIALFVNFFGSFVRLMSLIWCNNVHTANIIVGFLLAWCILFSGLFVYVSALPIWWQWAPWTSPAYYCLRSLFYTIISKKTVDGSCDAVEDLTLRLACLVQPDAFYAVGETALEKTGYATANLWFDVLALVGFHILCRAIYAIVLSWRNKNSFLKWCVTPKEKVEEE